MKKIIVAMLILGLILIGYSVISQMLTENKTENVLPVTTTVEGADESETKTEKETENENAGASETEKEVSDDADKKTEEKTEIPLRDMTLPDGTDYDFTKKQQEFQQKMDEMKEKFEEMQKTMNENVGKMQIPDMPDMLNMSNTSDTTVEQDTANE